MKAVAGLLLKVATPKRSVKFLMLLAVFLFLFANIIVHIPEATVRFFSKYIYIHSCITWLWYRGFHE